MPDVHFPTAVYYLQRSAGCGWCGFSNAFGGSCYSSKGQCTFPSAWWSTQSVRGCTSPKRTTLDNRVLLLQCNAPNPSASPRPSVSPASRSGGGGPSSGAVAGIVIAVFAVLLLAAMACWRKNCKAANNRHSQRPSTRRYASPQQTVERHDGLRVGAPASDYVSLDSARRAAVPFTPVPSAPVAPTNFSGLWPASSASGRNDNPESFSYTELTPPADVKAVRLLTAGDPV